MSSHRTYPEQLTVFRYFCARCGATQPAQRIPDGWFSLARQEDSALHRTGLYCSAECLVRHVLAGHSAEMVS